MHLHIKRVTVGLVIGLFVLGVATGTPLTFCELHGTTAPRIQIPLTARTSGCSSDVPVWYSAPHPLDPRKDRSFKREQYTVKQSLGTVREMEFVVYARTPEHLMVLPSRAGCLVDMLIVAVPHKGGIPQKIAQGLYVPTASAVITYSCSCMPVGVNKLTSYDINISVGAQFNGTLLTHLGGGVRPSLTLEGQAPIGDKVLQVTMSGVAGRDVDGDTPITIKVSSNRPQVPPIVVSGPLKSAFTIQNSAVVVESLENDLSSMTLAMANGEPLENITFSESPSTPVTTLPQFHRVDLVQREVWSRDALLSATKGQRLFLLIFGDPTDNVFESWEAGRSASLPFTLQGLSQLVKQQFAEPPVLAIFARAIPINMLFEDYLDVKPPCFVFSDFEDSKFTAIRQPGSHGFPRPEGSASLRQRLRLPEQGIVVIACDSEGNVLFNKQTRPEEFAGTIAEIKKALEK